jgi:hypothetical protein
MLYFQVLFYIGSLLLLSYHYSQLIPDIYVLSIPIQNYSCKLKPSDILQTYLNSGVNHNTVQHNKKKPWMYSRDHIRSRTRDTNPPPPKKKVSAQWMTELYTNYLASQTTYEVPDWQRGYGVSASNMTRCKRQVSTLKNFRHLISAFTMCRLWSVVTHYDTKKSFWPVFRN